MLFKLRCRKFVELIIEAAELKKKMTRLEDGIAEVEDDFGLIDMDVDDDASGGMNGFCGESPRLILPSTGGPWAGATPSTYESALNKAIAYGQTLQADYKTDTRTEVQGLFMKTFGIVAYEDPTEAEEVADVVSVETRFHLANELNKAILSAHHV